ncbi:MarR family transcriptional regulator [Cytobacillus depressus]|uniref:MarR family transcriptional regulator n=1 Tax=Cytobacillus depressus TaxID=1602942 RepID=A0A6L3V3Y1_9BACI|nr:MarR family transcriptional regulator [Cytobacillus depressus]KAB2334791.1 MarR family transcriptional regulator [Cytobacillus depressus]
MHCENQPNMRSGELFRAIWRVNLSMRKIVQRTAVTNDLTVPQYAVLMTLAPYREMTQKELGQMMQFPKSTLSQAVDGLVQAGFMERHPVKENRREMQLILSNEGKTQIQTMKEQEGGINRVFESAIDTLQAKQYAELLASLDQIAKFLEEKSPEQGEGSND